MASSGRWRSQAARDAALRFAPQRSALGESALEAREAYKNTVGAARSAATLTQRAAAAAKPEIQQIYSGAGAAQQAGTTLVSQALAQLGAGADPFKAAGATEAAQQLANLNSASARDQAMLHQQGVAARAGSQFAETNARATLQKTLQQLFSKNQSLTAEQGAYAQTEAEKLAHEADEAERQEREHAAGLEQAETASKRTAQTSRENSKEAHNGSGGSGYVGGVKQQTTSQQHAAAKELGEIRGLAVAAFREGHSRGQVLSILGEEEPATSKTVSERDKNGKPTGKSISHNFPARPAYAPTALVAAALDEAQFGGITKHTIDRLHAEGFSVKQLGLRALSPAQQRGVRVGGRVLHDTQAIFAPLQRH